MCGRYRRTTKEEELARIYHISIPKETDLPISYNIAPSQRSWPFDSILKYSSARSTPCSGDSFPHWAKDPKIGYRTINARAETVDKAPSFRLAFAKRGDSLKNGGLSGGKTPPVVGAHKSIQKQIHYKDFL